MVKNLYLISQEVNRGYDTYDSAVVVASEAEEARSMHPSGEVDVDLEVCSDGWAAPNDVSVKLIGTAVEGIEGVVCASFNAG
jgi:hypothetical protein